MCLQSRKLLLFLWFWIFSLLNSPLYLVLRQLYSRNRWFSFDFCLFCTIILDFICDCCEVILSNCRNCTSFVLTDSHSKLLISCRLNLRYGMHFEYLPDSVVSIFLAICQIMPLDNWPRCQLTRRAISYHMISGLVIFGNKPTELVPLLAERHEGTHFRVGRDHWE